jgi:ABC-type lipoprotein export system ATPase subunit
LEQSVNAFFKDSQGEIEIHALLKQMQQQPVIIVRHDSKVAGTKKIVKVFFTLKNNACSDNL